MTYRSKQLREPRNASGESKAGAELPITEGLAATARSLRGKKGRQSEYDITAFCVSMCKTAKAEGVEEALKLVRKNQNVEARAAALCSLGHFASEQGDKKRAAELLRAAATDAIEMRGQYIDSVTSSRDLALHTVAMFQIELGEREQARETIKHITAFVYVLSAVDALDKASR